MRQTAVIVGATSGIGLALAEEMHRAGYRLGLAARREEILSELAARFGSGTEIQRLDVTEPAAASSAFGQLLERLGTVDVVVLCSGVSYFSKELTWAQEEHTVAVNVAGFSSLAVAAFDAFARQGRGHLVAISSVAGVRGLGLAPAYSGSKAFVSRYCEALRQRARKKRFAIVVTDVRPGYIDTPMLRAQGGGSFWVVGAEVAARQILAAIRRRKKVVYVPRRWGLVAWLMLWVPDWMFDRF